jgi:hypothetical protein
MKNNLNSLNFKVLKFHIFYIMHVINNILLSNFFYLNAFIIWVSLIFFCKIALNVLN